MEIEAKFRVPNREVHRELLRLRSIAGYTIARLGRVEVVDRYFDTADGRLLASHYACRLRSQPGQVIATLKGVDSGEGTGSAEGLRRAEDGLHRRDEREVTLPALLLDPRKWPESTARQLALDLTAGAPLQPLFDLHQSRAKADLMDGVRRVGEWSLDEVRAVVGRRPAFYYELEIELGPDGLESDLERASQVLQAEHGLEPEPRSKFARGLDMLRLRGAAVEGGVSDEERSQLTAYEAGSDTELARRAGAVLAWAGGLPTREIVVRTRLSAGRVRFWLREFRAKRMGIFAPGQAAPEDTPAEPRPASPAARPGAARRARELPAPPSRARRTHSPKATPPSPPAPPEPAALPALQAPAAGQAAPQPSPSGGAVGKKARRAAKEGLPTVADFAHVHGVNGPRARCVADNALTLFDALRKVHGLPRKRRKLLRAAALLATAGAAQDREEPERAGRDLILAQPLHGVTTEDRLALACIVALQRGKMRPGKEPALEALEPKRRKEVIAHACLLRLASALSCGQGQGTTIRPPECKGGDACEISLEGAHAEADARHANAAARYWHEHLKHDLSFAAAQPPAPAAIEGATAPASPAVQTSGTSGPTPELPAVETAEPMSEAGRKTMFTHFMKMLANEAGTRDGKDVEFLHDMRVATRRLRAAYRIFEPFYQKHAVSAFNKELRRAGAALGAVRDLDVLIEKAEAYDAALASEEGLTLAPLLSAWKTKREAARRDLQDYLDGRSYQKFVEEFRTFLLTPGLGAETIPPGQPVAHQVRHVVPRLILERYEHVRAYEAVLLDAPVTTYHALRIDCKRLRYALEFFSALIGPGAADLIKRVVALQELLGALQDAHVAEGLIVEFMSEQRGRQERSQPPRGGKKSDDGPGADAIPGVEAYLLTQQHIQADLLGLFENPWQSITGADFRRSLGLALATP